MGRFSAACCYTDPMGTRDRKPRPKSSNYITSEGLQRFQKELEMLWVERPKVVQGVADAAAEGDRSENAEYIYGKKRLREIDRRIQFITTRLDKLKLVDSSLGARQDPEKVFFGAWVRVEDEDGEVFEYRIVGPDEHDLHPQYISMDGPLGKAILGKRLDDEVYVRRPKGDVYFTILEVQYTAFGSS